MARNVDAHLRGRGGQREPFALKLTEQDHDLAIRGYIIARTGVLPTDPSFKELSANEDLLRFTAYWLQKRETDLFDSVTRALGVTWSRDQIAAMTSDQKSAKAPSDIFLPLAAGINPELIEGLGKVFRVDKGDFIGGGEYVSESHEEVVQLGDLPKDEFMEWAAAATGTMRSVAAHMEEQQQTVKVQEGPSSDERIERIRGQIEQSKKWQE